MKKPTARAASILRELAAGSSSDSAARFERVAKTYTAKATESRKKARDTLVNLGIHTSKGKLSKRYK